MPMTSRGVSVKVSAKTHRLLRRIKRQTGLPMTYMIERALYLYLKSRRSR